MSERETHPYWPYYLETDNGEGLKDAKEYPTVAAVLKAIEEMRGEFGDRVKAVLHVPRLWIDPDSCTNLEPGQKRFPCFWVSAGDPQRQSIGDVASGERHARLRSCVFPPPGVDHPVDRASESWHFLNLKKLLREVKRMNP